MTNNELIYKFLNQQLSENELALFNKKFETDEIFRDKLNEKAEIEAFLQLGVLEKINKKYSEKKLRQTFSVVAMLFFAGIVIFATWHVGSQKHNVAYENLKSKYDSTIRTRDVQIEKYKKQLAIKNKKESDIKTIDKFVPIKKDEHKEKEQAIEKPWLAVTGKFKEFKFDDELIENSKMGKTVFETPPIGMKYKGKLIFRWNKVFDKDLKLKIYTFATRAKPGVVVIDKSKSEYIFTQKLAPDLYYWKLTYPNGSLTGKFYVYD